MKITKLIGSLLLAGGVAGGLGAESVRAQGVLIKVNVTEAPKTKGSSDAKILEIAVSNVKAVALTNLTVQYWIFSRDVEDKTVSAAQEGRLPLSLKPSGREVLKSAEANFQLKRGKVSGSGRNARPSKSKGSKYYGYGVRVIDDATTTTLAEVFEPIETKAKVSGEAQAPADKAAKPPAK